MPKCKVCAEKFTLTFSSFQKTCDKPECLAAWGKHLVAKEKQKAEKQSAKEFREWKKEAIERSAKLGDLKANLQKNINKITSIIDGNMNCISCNAPITQTNIANAGHRWSVGANPHLRYNLHVIHRQGVCCNKWKSGNPDGYDKGLTNTYGEKYADFVKSLHDCQFNLKLSRHEIVKKNKLALHFISHLKKLDPNYIVENRLKLRNEGNVFLGIYNVKFAE